MNMLLNSLMPLSYEFFQNTFFAKRIHKVHAKICKPIITIFSKFKNNCFQNNSKILEYYIKKIIISNLVITTASK